MTVPTVPAVPAPDDAEHADRSLAYTVVMQALSELERIDSTALRLIYWHGRTQEQVADELQVSLPTIRTAVGRGMQRLAGLIVTR